MDINNSNISDNENVRNNNIHNDGVSDQVNQPTAWDAAPQTTAAQTASSSSAAAQDTAAQTAASNYTAAGGDIQPGQPVNSSYANNGYTQYNYSRQQQYQNTPGQSEYIYNNYDQTPRKRRNGGKTALAVIAALLAVFVVSVTSISIYEFVTTGGLPASDPNVSDSDGDDNMIVTPGQGLTDLEKNEDDSNTESEDKAAEQSSTVNKDFPTLEQLAAPEDAMSLPDIYDKVAPSVVGVSCTLRNGSATGTGIIISEDGYIITNAHVVEDAVSVMIVDSEMNEYSAEIIGSDAQTDIAVLKIDETGLTPCEFGSSSNIRIGELTVVIGNPLGFELYGSMSSGIISGLNRSITIGEKKMTLIQTTASITNGNSGGPLINAYGQVIGITSAKVASIYGENLGFAIPIDNAIPIINDLMKYGYVTGRPMIGISGEDITSIMSMFYRIPEGVYVRFITPDSGAELAGIKAGDIIIGADGETVTTMDDLNEIKNRFSAGDTITLTIYRDGESMDIDVVMTEVTDSTEE